MTNARTAKSTREKAAQLRAEAARAESRRRTVTVTAAVAAVIVVLVAAAVLLRSAADGQRARDTLAVPANLHQGGILVGSADAPVTIEVYEDFLCPACGRFEEQNQAQIASWVADDRVRVVYRPVAILDRLSPDRYSTRALNAAAAVVNSTPQAFAAFHEALFTDQPAENAPGLSDDRLVELAVAAGADRAVVGPEITGGRYERWAQQTTEEFSRRGFTGTPTVLVNGTQVPDWSTAGLATTVEGALASATSGRADGAAGSGAASPAAS